MCMEENENKNYNNKNIGNNRPTADDIIPAIGEKWFTEFGGDEDDEPVRETHHRHSGEHHVHHEHREHEQEHHEHREHHEHHVHHRENVRREPVRRRTAEPEPPEEVFSDVGAVIGAYAEKPQAGSREPQEKLFADVHDNDIADMNDGADFAAREDVPHVIAEEYAAEEFAELPDDYTDDETEPVEYVRRNGNRGAAFTMRTSDDHDPKKIRSRQTEYTSEADRDIVRESILRMRSHLMVRSAVLLVASVFSLFISIANDLEQPMAAVFDRTINPSAYIFTNTILGIIAVGFSYSVVVNGFKNLFRLSPDSDTLVSLNLIAALISGLVTLFEPESLKYGYFHIYTSAAITLLLVSTLGKLSIVRRTLRSFDFMTESDGLAAVQQADGDELSSLRTRKRRDIAFMRKTDIVRDFMKNSYSSDLADLFAEKTVPVILIASILVGALSWKFDKHGTNNQEKMFVLLAAISGTISICSAFSLVMIANRPLTNACKKLMGCSAVLLGYSSVEEHADTDTVVISAHQLFPEGSVEIMGLKMLSSRFSEEQALLLAASLAKAGGSVTADALYDRLGTGERLRTVNVCVAEPSMGVSGWIDSKRVMLGGREMLEKYHVRGLLTAAAEERFGKRRGAVYLAVAGEAVMIFSAELNADRLMRRQMQALEYERVSINIRSCDAFLKQESLAHMFDIKTSSITMLPESCGDEFDIISEPAESVSASMFCEENAGAFAMLIVAAKRVKYAANLGVAVQYGSVILGILISVILMLMGSFAQINPTVIFVYNIIFVVLMKLIQDVKRL